MTEVIVHVDDDKLPKATSHVIPVHLYGSSPEGRGSAVIGSQISQMLRRVVQPVDGLAFDFLAIALAATAADTFVDRSTSADGWVRDLRLTVSVRDPAPWIGIRELLERALRFLSGDSWKLTIVGGGALVPPKMVRPLRAVDLANSDSACLFSGGLDSLIGVLDQHASGKRPVLVSHAYPRDRQRQTELLAELPQDLVWFGANAHPSSTLASPHDVQMRTRSLNFLALGTVMAATIAGLRGGVIPLIVPENGLIAINPPLTRRRIGALSTRTTHPHFLGLIQEIFDGVGLPVKILNPYETRTKGEMFITCLDQARLSKLASNTVSCGKWKRKGVQCGKCVPCLIRRSSFLAAGYKDKTEYQEGGSVLPDVLTKEKGFDDLLAMILAVRSLQSRSVTRWVSSTGPMPTDDVRRAGLVNVVERGLREVGVLLAREKLI